MATTTPKVVVVTAEILVVKEVDKMADEGEEEEEEEPLARQVKARQAKAKHVKSSALEASQQQDKLRHVKSRHIKLIEASCGEARQVKSKQRYIRSNYSSYEHSLCIIRQLLNNTMDPPPKKQSKDERIAYPSEQCLLDKQAMLEEWLYAPFVDPVPCTLIDFVSFISLATTI